MKTTDVALYKNEMGLRGEKHLERYGNLYDDIQFPKQLYGRPRLHLHQEISQCVIQVAWYWKVLMAYKGLPVTAK